MGGVLYDATGAYIMAFVFAGILCFVAAGCSVVVWSLARSRLDEVSRPVAAVSPHPDEDLNRLGGCKVVPAPLPDKECVT